MADSKSEAGNVQDESETSCHTRKQGSYERWRESHQKDLGDSLKWLPMAKDGIIWASIITAVNFSIKYVKYLFVIILEKRKKKRKETSLVTFLGCQGINTLFWKSVNDGEKTIKHSTYLHVKIYHSILKH